MPDVLEAAFREGYEQGRANGEIHHIPDDAWRCSNARGALQARPDAALVEELERMADGLRGSMWANRNEIIDLLDRAASALRTHDDTLEEAAKVAEESTQDEPMVTNYCGICEAAAERIEALEAENARLREAPAL